MRYARENDDAVFTHDLDFGAKLALTQAASPSTLKIRAQDVLPNSVGEIVTAILRKYQNEIEQGALIVFDEAKERVRVLPLEKRER